VTLHPVTASRLEKAATDNGFDLDRAPDGDWLHFASTQSPLHIWLTAPDREQCTVALSLANVARALDGFGAAVHGSLPSGAAGARTVTAIPALHALLRRAFHLSRTLPDELLHGFKQQTAALPRATEAERLVVQRVGQEIFRGGLLEYWDGRCAVTGLAVSALLRASHIKPWAACETDAERLDVFNGLLLAPHLDAAFDGGFITVADDGAVLVSSRLDSAARGVLGLGGPLCVVELADGHRRYLAWHREYEFKA